MADMYPVAGCRLFIGGAMSAVNADLEAEDFDGQAWTEIDGWITMGQIGDNSALITQPMINRGRDVKMKGTANAGSMANVFAALDDDPGQLAFIAAAQPSNRSNYAFRMLMNDAPAERSATVTISNATPGVVGWADHGLANGAAVVFSTTGSLPTGLTAGTTYYVVNADEDDFEVAATPGGSPINTSSAGSGTHTATTEPAPSERLFIGLAMSAQEQGGDANTGRQLTGTIEINSNIVKVGALG